MNTSSIRSVDKFFFTSAVIGTSGTTFTALSKSEKELGLVSFFKFGGSAEGKAFIVPEWDLIRPRGWSPSPSSTDSGSTKHERERERETVSDYV